jgi:hypothetical protein
MKPRFGTFFEVVDQLTRAGAVDAEQLCPRYAWWIRSYWLLYRPAVERMRQALKDKEGAL